MQTPCPGCGSQQAQLMDQIGIDALIAGYEASYLRTPVQRLLDRDQGPLQLWRCQGCDLQWFAPPSPGDDRFYEDLQQHDWYYQDKKPEYPLASAWLPSPPAGQPLQLLEVGCGRGAFARHLGPQVRYRGLEFNDAAVAQARAAGLDVQRQPIQAVAQAQPGQFDVVCHFQVLEHVPDVAGFMAACAQALRPGGLLITTVPSDDSFVGVAGGNWLNMPPHHVTRWSDRALRSLFERLGMTQLQLQHEPVADFHADWYRKTLVQLALARLLGQKPGLGTAAGWPARLGQRLAGPGWWGDVLLARAERGFAFAGRGHSVTIAGTKAG